VCPLCFVVVGYDPTPQVCYQRHITWHQTIRDGQDVRVGIVDLPGTTKGEVYEVTVTWETPMPSAVYDVAMDPQEQYQTRTVVLEQSEMTARLQITSILDWTSEPRQARVVAHAVTPQEA
jgi:hypothetical protein